MERIKEGRRDILIHPDAEVDDLPVENLTELPKIAERESFVPQGMDRPTLYTGDVLVGVDDGAIEFVELIYDKADKGVVVFELDTALHKQLTESDFSKRFYSTDQIHIFSEVVNEVVDSDVTFDAGQLPTVSVGRL